MDFAYLRCAHCWVYLCVVRDAHSRRVQGYIMGEQQSTDLVHRTRHGRATRGGFPAGGVLHADRGTQFIPQKMAAYRHAVKGTVSMWQAGACWNDVMADSFLGHPHNRVLLPTYLYRLFILEGVGVVCGVGRVVAG